VPLLLIDKFNNDKKKFIGKIFANDKIKTEYECIDVKMKSEVNKKYNDVYPTMHLSLKNSISGKVKDCPVNNVEELCFADDITGRYRSTLVKVEKPANESIRYGETKIVEVEGVTKYNYIDDYIDILIFGGDSKFIFLLKNISQNTLKLIWNEAVFVDFNGRSSKVMHTGTKYSQKDADQPSSTIIKGSSIDDVAVPTSKIRYSDILNDWVTHSMYPDKQATIPGEVKLMLPIQVKDVINEYIFVFRVDWIYDHPELLKNTI
jgi:hypothetical protein